MGKIFDYIEEWFLVITLGTMLVLNFANVLSRYFLGLSFSFTEEITTNLFVWSCFVGASAAAKRGSHLGLSVFTDLMPPRLQRYTTVVVSLLTLVMFGVIVATGIEMVMSQMEHNQMSPALGIPEWTMGLAVPVGALFCFIRFAQAGWKEWQKGVN